MKLVKMDGKVVDLDAAEESFATCQKYVEGYIQTLSIPGRLVFLLDEDAEPKRVGPNFAAITMLQALDVDRSETLLGPVVVLESQAEVDAILGGSE